MGRKNDRGGGIRRLVFQGLAIACLVVLPGCIVVAEREVICDSDDSVQSSPTKVRLSEAERAQLPTITSLVDLPTVQSRYGDQIRGLNGETSLDQFRTVFPGAFFVERRSIGDTTVDAYALRIDEKCRYRSTDYGYRARDERWFFFKNGRYVKYGPPREWPQF